MLDQVKAGDKVKFAAERVNGAVTIVELKASRCKPFHPDRRSP